jgi:hypothetical protein
VDRHCWEVSGEGVRWTLGLGGKIGEVIAWSTEFQVVDCCLPGGIKDPGKGLSGPYHKGIAGGVFH